MAVSLSSMTQVVRRALTTKKSGKKAKESAPGGIEKIGRDAFLYFDPSPKSPANQFAQCGTCRMFVPGDAGAPDRCIVHGSDVKVGENYSCGLYVVWPTGKPDAEAVAEHAKALDAGVPGSVTPKTSGLVDRQVRCQNCAHFDGSKSCELYAELNAKEPKFFDLITLVNPQGCCNAQTARPGSQNATESRRAIQREVAKRAIAEGMKRADMRMESNVLIVGAKKFREAIAISGSSEDQANRTHAQAKALRKHVRALGKAVSASPCPCGRRGHKPSLMATFPESKNVITSCPNGLHSASYAVKDGKLVLGAGAPVEATVKKAKPRESSTQKPKVLRESATDKTANASLNFVARIREAKISGDGAQAICVMLEEGPGNPADRHYYPGETLKEAVEAGIFEGAHTFADHPTAVEDRIRPERSVRDLIGWWSDVHIEESDGKVAIVGTYNLECGNEFALNKMREAKRYAERNPEKPGYVGFSIAAAGVSRPQEIDGKTYNVVDRITEAVSTDMVTRAGAGGKLLSLKEAQMAKNKTALDARKIAESAASAAVKKLLESDAKRVKSALEAIGVELTPEQDEQLDKALSVTDGGSTDDAIDQTTGQDDDGDSAEIESDDMESDTMEDVMGDDDDDSDDDDDDDDMDADVDGNDDDAPVEARKKTKEAATAALARENARLKAENKKLLARESSIKMRSAATKICESMNVPKQARRYVMHELLECKDEAAMKSRASALLEGIIRPAFGSGVDGAPARTTESTSLITL